MLTNKDSPNTHGAGGQIEFLAEFHSRETEGDNEKWEENKQHGATCCVTLKPEDDDKERVCVCLFVCVCVCVGGSLYLR